MGEIMIAALFAAGSLSVTQACPNQIANETLVQELSLPRAGRTLNASTYLISGLGPHDIGATRLVVRTSACDVLFEQEFEGTSDIKLTISELGKTPILVATALSQGGSGCGLTHLLLTYYGDLKVLAPTDLDHDNMGAFYVGDLSGSKGPGLVLFEALWEGGSHYAPHSYRVWTYRWTAQHFAGPSVVTTAPMSPNPKQVAKALGYPFSDEMNFAC